MQRGDHTIAPLFVVSVPSPTSHLKSLSADSSTTVPAASGGPHTVSHARALLHANRVLLWSPGAVMRLLIIIPTYNERENIELLVREILSVGPEFNLLIVDDASPDGTGDVVDGLARADERIHVLHRSGKLGLGTAYLDGFRYALTNEYDRVVQMDADHSHRPVDLLQLVAASEHADLVIGSRNIPGGQIEDWSLIRRMVSRGGSLYTRWLLHVPIRDCTSGFKCIRCTVLRSLDLGQVRSNGYGFQVEMNYLCYLRHWRITEVPIVFPDRTAGQSKMSFTILLEAARLVWKLRRTAGRVVEELPADTRQVVPDVVKTK